MMTIMITAAMAPVMMKVRMVEPMILPARLRLRMVATDPPMDENTMGTTMQNIMFRNRVPRGLSTVAPASMTTSLASLTWGHIQPTTAPRIMDPSMTARNA